MDGGKKVWVPDNEHGFRLGEIVDLGSDTITVELDGPSGKVCIERSITTETVFCLELHQYGGLHLRQVVTAPYDRAFPSEKDNSRDFEDNCKSASPKQIMYEGVNDGNVVALKLATSLSYYTSI